MQDLSKERIELLQKCTALFGWMERECGSKMVKKYYCPKCFNLICDYDDTTYYSFRTCKNCGIASQCARNIMLYTPLEHQLREIIHEKLGEMGLQEIKFITHEKGVYVPNYCLVKMLSHEYSSGNTETFKAKTVEQALDIACEYILSDGKNDLREATA